jgi:uncharacterized lipoprotein (TIGR02269 family)
MTALTKCWGLLLCLFLVACAASDSTTRSGGTEALELMAAWEAAGDGGERCEEEDACVTLVCDEEVCSFFHCEDVAREPEGVLLALRGGITAPPGSGPRRNWGGRQGKRGDGLPVFIVPWRFHDRRDQLPSELERLKIRDPIKHHLFPRQRKLAEWFKRKGINIHEHTMVVEREVHDRIHRGKEGGQWNAEWREFVRNNEGATQAQIWEHALKLILRYELTGPIVPYHWRVRPRVPHRQEK